jgi:hypothetical protein
MTVSIGWRSLLERRARRAFHRFQGSLGSEG